jgi:hypothetical protein
VGVLMKIKIDHITNSSSASFVLANFDKTKPLGKLKLEIEVNLKDLYLKTLKTPEEIEENFDCKDRNDIYLKPIFDAQSEGADIVVVTVSTGEGGLEQFLIDEGLRQDMIINPKLKVIHGDGGI